MDSEPKVEQIAGGSTGRFVVGVEGLSARPVAKHLVQNVPEPHHLADRKDCFDILNRLRGKLKAFQLRTKDPWQIMWGHESQEQGTGGNL